MSDFLSTVISKLPLRYHSSWANPRGIYFNLQSERKTELLFSNFWLVTTLKQKLTHLKLWQIFCGNTESQACTCVCTVQLPPLFWVYSFIACDMGITVHTEAHLFPSSNHLSSQSQNMWSYSTHIWKISFFFLLYCHDLGTLTSSLSVMSILTALKQGKKWTEQNLNFEHSLLVMAVPHHIEYFRLACGKVSINTGNTFKTNFWMTDGLGTVISNAEHDLCAHNTHSFVMHACVGMICRKILGRITISNCGDDVVLFFDWLPCRVVVGGWKHSLFYC